MSVIGILCGFGGYYLIVGLILWAHAPWTFPCTCRPGQAEACSDCGKMLSPIRVILGWPWWVIQPGSEQRRRFYV